jgi:hypothetical protein
MNTLNNLLPYAGPLASLAAALIAASTSILVAIWARRTQKRLVERQSELQKEVSRSIESVKDLLERGRSFDVFIRDRIIAHMDNVLRAYDKVSSLCYLVGRRSWVEAGKLPEGDVEFYSQIYSLKTHLGVLVKLKAITSDLYDRCFKAAVSVESGWEGVTNELTALNPEFLKQHSGERAFSPQEFNHRWGKLLEAVRKLEEEVLPIPASVSIPK